MWEISHVGDYLHPAYKLIHLCTVSTDVQHIPCGIHLPCDIHLSCDIYLHHVIYIYYVVYIYHVI